MGTDIWTESYNANHERIGGVGAFDCRCYNWFAFLAGVRNGHGITPIASGRGSPSWLEMKCNCSDFDPCDCLPSNWVSVDELRSYDYATPVQIEAAGGRKEAVLMREFLGKDFFSELDRLDKLGVCYVVMWFSY